jgi:hypothetical protein
MAEAGTRYAYNGQYYNSPEEVEAAKNKDYYNTGAGSAGAAGTALGTAQQTGGGADYSIDPTGRTSYSNETNQQKDILNLQSQLKAKDRDSFLSLVSSTNGGPSSPTVAAPSVQGSETDARAAAFARAKDQAGKIARASLSSITEQMAGRGIAGSGIEALKSAGAINGAEAPLQDLTRSQMISDNNRAADVSDMGYQGAIAQRGQDLSSRASYMSMLRSLY